MFKNDFAYAISIKISLADPNSAHYILVLIAWSNNKDSDEPAQMRRLFRIFVARIHKVLLSMKILSAGYVSFGRLMAFARQRFR